MDTGVTAKTISGRVDFAGDSNLFDFAGVSNLFEIDGLRFESGLVVLVELWRRLIDRS